MTLDDSAFGQFKSLEKKGNFVKIHLSTGQIKEGQIEEIGNDYIKIIDQNHQKIIISNLVFGGWEPLNQTSLSLNNLDSSLNTQNLEIVNKISSSFKNKIKLAEMNIKPPDFTFPLKDPTENLKTRNEIRKDWDRIMSQYQSNIKQNKILVIPMLALDLINLSEKTSNKEKFFYNAGCFYCVCQDWPTAIQNFEKSIKNSKNNDIKNKSLYNIAFCNKQEKELEKQLTSLTLYFTSTLPSSDEDTWYIFVSLIEYFEFFKMLREPVQFIVSKNKMDFSALGSVNEADLQILCNTFVYILDQTKNYNIINNFLSCFKNKTPNFNKIQIYIDEIINLFPNKQSKYYEFAKKKVFESSSKDEIKKSLKYSQIQPQGYIFDFKNGNAYGFIVESGESNAEYFFHISNIVDNELLKMIRNWKPGTRIPVLFNTKNVESGKHPEAEQIRLFKDIDELIQNAEELAEKGEYQKAILLIKKVLTINPNMDLAKDLDDKYHKWARITSVPPGNSPYSRAKRAQMIEMDYEKAEKYFLEAIEKRDRTDSAIKDLAQILDKEKKLDKAIEVMEKHIRLVSDKLSSFRQLEALYEKAQRYDDAIKYLGKIVELSKTDDAKNRSLLRMASIELKRDKIKEAEDIINKILIKDPNNLLSLKNLAQIRLKQNNLSDAEVILLKILDKNSTDTQTIRYLEAIKKAKQTGESVSFKEESEDLVKEDIGNFWEIESSTFTKFFLNRTEFRMIPSYNYNKTEDGSVKYVGNKKAAREDFNTLYKQAHSIEFKIAADKSDFFLMLAKLCEPQILDNNRDFYRFLFLSFYQKGDATIQEGCKDNLTIFEPMYLDAARTWYSEALIIFKNIWERGNNRYLDDTVKYGASFSIIRYLFCIIGLTSVPLKDPDHMPTLEKTIDSLFNNPNHKKIFDAILYLIIYSQYAFDQILPILYKATNLRALSQNYLKLEGFTNIENLNLELFCETWKKLGLSKFLELDEIFKTLAKFNEISFNISEVEDIINSTSQLIGFAPFDVDNGRLEKIKESFELIFEFLKSDSWDKQQGLLININNILSELEKSIQKFPTKLGIEQIYPIITNIKNFLSKKSQELLNIKPIISIDLSRGEVYYPNDNYEIEIELLILNEIKSPPVMNLTLNIEEKKEFYSVFNQKIDKGIIHGGEQINVKIKLIITEKAIDTQGFQIPIDLKYTTKSGYSDSLIVEKEVRIYPTKDFIEINNPYTKINSGTAVKDPNMVYGRNEEKLKIISTLEQLRDTVKGYLFYGQKRSGKSTILSQTILELNKKGAFVVQIENLNLSDLNKNPLELVFYYNILSKLKESIFLKVLQERWPDLEIDIVNEDEFVKNTNPIEYFKDIFKEFNQKRQKLEKWKDAIVVVAIDEFTTIYDKIMAKKISPHFMRTWRSVNESNLFSVIMVGQDFTPKFKSLDPNSFGIFKDERISYIKDEDALLLIEKPIRIGGPQGKSRYNQNAKEMILTLTGGNPYYIVRFCDCLVEYMNKMRYPYVIETDIERVKDLILNDFTIHDFDNLINSGDTSPDRIEDSDSLSVLKAIAKNSKQSGFCNLNQINVTTNKPLLDILKDLVDREVLIQESSENYRIKVGLFREFLRKKY